VRIFAGDPRVAPCGNGANVIITRGKVTAPLRWVVFGEPGIGKTTFACGFPSALALDYERGTNHLDVMRTPGASTWEDSLKLLEHACEDAGEWRTIVVDTIDALESQLAQDICARAKKRDLADFDHGGGIVALGGRWREFFDALRHSDKHGRDVVLVAHVQRTEVKDPVLGSYATWAPVMNKRTWPLVHRWADCVLFASYEAGMSKGLVSLTGRRMLHTVAGSGYQAKNRLGLPDEIEMDEPAGEEAHALIASHREPARSRDMIEASIHAMLVGASEELITRVAVAVRGAEDATALLAVERRLRVTKQKKETGS
jgi:AAA domain